METSLRVALPPPALFGIILVAGAALDYIHPLRVLPESLTLRLSTGGAICILGAAIGAWASVTFHRSNTSPDFGNPVVRLIEHGPYRFSRNPMYLALNTVLLGFAFLLNSVWLVSGVPILLFVLDRTVIVQEERFLETRFGDHYRSYLRRVRRWL